MNSPIPKDTEGRVLLLIELAAEIGLLRGLEQPLSEAQEAMLRRCTCQRDELLELTGIRRAIERQQSEDLDLTSDFH